MNIIFLCSLIFLSSSSVLNQLAPLKKIMNKSLITIAPLKKMVNKQLIDVIMDHQKDPAYLLSVLSNVDPTQLNAVIVLIKALLAASESDLAALNLASTNANTAYTDATVAYDAAVLAKAALVSAYGDANVLAEKHYTDANTVRETAYTAESAVRETAYTAESAVLDQQVNDLFVVQTEANGAKKNAQGTLDTERIRLNGEIATLMQVIALLEGLGFSAPPTSSPTPATTSSPTPAAPGVTTYNLFSNRNCLAPVFDKSPRALDDIMYFLPIVTSDVDNCKAQCSADITCDCVVYIRKSKPFDMNCWKRKDCVADNFINSNVYDVYMKIG